MTAVHAKRHTTLSEKFHDPAWLAFALLRTMLTVAPIVFGLDKFFNLLTYWPQYLAPVATDIAPLGGQEFMYMVGIVEIIAGLTVLIAPRYGSALVALWLSGIIANLLIVGDFYDVALRDFGLLVAALALFCLTFHRVDSAARSATTGDAATDDAAASEREYSHA